MMRAALMVAFLGVSTLAVAHHSFATYDTTQQVTLAGTVKAFTLSNPHSSIALLVPGPGGSDVTWAVQMNSPMNLIRVGWKPNTLKAGDKVVIIINPSKAEANTGAYVSGSWPDGKAIVDIK